MKKYSVSLGNNRYLVFASSFEEAEIKAKDFELAYYYWIKNHSDTIIAVKEITNDCKESYLAVIK